MMKKNMVNKNIENEKLVAILAYFIIGIILYFAEEKMKKSALATFHTKQVLTLSS